MNEESIFAAALGIQEAAKRAAFLEAMCGDEPALKERIEARLAADAASGEATVRPTAQVAATADYRPAAETVGSSIGHYKLLQTIGEGGFGVVYMAEQQHPVRRKVALKIIKPGMDTKDVIARFESERQALALMDHPNIARVLDAGSTASGRPYFVMELVKGVPITEYCDKNHATTEKRLALFVDVCHAVQHAHQKGVIHRDIKPSNVMVTLHDGKPVPKVIDFGVAKATSQQLTERTLFTAYGQMIGTPAYMSPEQAEMSGLDIDTRSDIYSLGVLLYELLTGTTPFDIGRLRDAGYVEMQRIIREEEPPRPSTRISTLGDKLTIVSSHRSTDPKKLRQALRGDLDVIVMKALDKERSRRYETPNSFAADVERYLHQEAIQARPPSAVYRFRKFTQRNKAAVATAGAVFLCLLAGTITSTLLAIRATTERKRAEESLVETKKQREAAEAATVVAQRERDRAEKANQSEVAERKKAEQQQQVAEEERKAADVAKQDAVAQRGAAETERDKAKKLNDELNRQKEHQRRMLYVAQMSLIQKAWDADNISRVRELLNSIRPRPGEPDLRGFEWHYWQRMCHNDLATMKVGAPRGQRMGLTFSRDATRVAMVEFNTGNTATARNELQVWDATTGKQLLSKPLVEEAKPAASADAAGKAAPYVSRSYRTCFVDDQRVAVSSYEYSAGAKHPVRLRVMHLNDEAKSFSIQITAPTSASDLFVINHDGSRIAAIVFRGQEGNANAHEIIQVWDGHTGKEIAQVALPFALDLYSQRLAISPDGARVALNGRATGLSAATAPRGGIHVFEVESGKSTTIGGTFLGRILEFSPDGSRIAAVGTAGGQSIARVWNAATGEEVSRISESASTISDLVFSPDGAVLATCSHIGQQPARSVRLWETTAGRQIAEFKGHIQSIRDVAFSADGSQLLSADYGGVIKSWQAPASKSIPRTTGVAIPFGNIAAAAAAALSKPGATASLGSAVKEIFEGAQARAKNVLDVVIGQIHAHSPDGKWIAYSAATAVYSASPNVMVVDTTDTTDGPTQFRLYGRSSTVSVTGKSKTAPLPLTGPLSFALFSLDGTSLATASRVSASDVTKGIELKVWDVASGELRLSVQAEPSMTSLQLLPGAAEAIAFSPSGRLLAMYTTKVVNNSKIIVVQVWDVAAGRELYTIDSLRFSGGRMGLRFSPSSDELMTGSADSLNLAPRTVQVVGSNRTMLSGPLSGIQIWDAATGRLRWEEVRATSLAGFNSDGVVMAFMQTSGSGAAAGPGIMFWDGQTGEQRSRIPLERGQTYLKLALSHDRSRVAVASGPSDTGTGEVAIFDVESGERLLSLEGHNGLVASIAFSSDDKRIATSAGVSARFAGSGGSGGETKVWDAATGQELLTLTGGSDVLTFSDRRLGADPSVEPFASAASAAWDASPLARQIEAGEIVEWLLAKGDQGRMLSRGKLTEQLKADSTLREEVRTIALELARAARRDALALNNEAWAIVKVAGAPREDYVQALDYAAEACQVAPDRAAYLNTLGGAHYRLGQYSEALTALEKAVSLHAAAKEASSPEDWLFLAMTHHHLGRGEQARTYFQQGDRVIQSLSLRKPEWSAILAEAHELLAVPPASSLIASGSAWRQKREFEKALTEFDAAIRLDPQRAIAYAYRGRTWSDKRDYDKAVADYDEAIRIDGKVAWFFAYRGYDWKQKGNRDQAVGDLNEAIRLDPTYSWAFAQRARIWRLKNDVDSALKDCDEAIRLDSKVGWYYSDRGIVWRMKGDYDKAIADYDVAIRLEPSATVHNNRGYALRQKGQHDEALVAYNESLRLNPNYATAYANRGSLWRQKGDLDKALADYDEALRCSPGDAGYYNARGGIRAQRQEYDKAIADYDEAIRLNPQSPATNNRALLLATCPDEKYRDGKRAVEEATKVCERSQWKTATHLDTLAAAYAECGNFEQARQWIEKAISLASGSAKRDMEARLALYREGKPYRRMAEEKAAD